MAFVKRILSTVILCVFFCEWTVYAQPSDLPKIEALFIVDSVIEDEFSAHIILNNTGTIPIKDWALGFTFQRSINSLSGAKLLKQIGDYYLIGAPEDNKTLPAHGAFRLDMTGKYTIRNNDDSPKGYFLMSMEKSGQYGTPEPIIGKFFPPLSKKAYSPKSIYLLNIQHNNTPIEGNVPRLQHAEKTPSIVPLPAEMTPETGFFVLHSDTPVFTIGRTNDLVNTAHFLADTLQPATGFRLEVKQTDAVNSNVNGIYLELSDKASSLGVEGYMLHVTQKNILIQAATSAGLFYGVQSLRQLFPPQLFSHSLQSNIIWKAPSVLIRDEPRFPYRGLLFDVARHFFPTEHVKRLIDLMAIHKLNVLHWHLTDDEGWRIEIKKYPELTNIGAWRGFNDVLPPSLGSGISRYGGFYTQEQIRDIVHYAQLRHITIIPEIEMPGHARAMIQSLPNELIDKEDKSIYSGPRGFHDNVLSPCKPATYEVINSILSEVIALFPSKVIHIGGDELPRGVWEKSPACIAFMKKAGLKNTGELHNYFSRRIQDFLTTHNRILGGWEEITHNGLLALQPTPLIYAWLGLNNWVRLKDYDVILSPYQYLYLEMAYSPNPQEPGEYWGGYLDTFKVYSYTPIMPSMPEAMKAHVKGIEGALWTEYITEKNLDYLAFPKILALSEVAWTKAALRNWVDFSTRLGHTQLPRLDYYGVLYRLPSPGINRVGNTIHANVEFPGLAMRYTLNGQLPSIDSHLYINPVQNMPNSVWMCTFNILGRSSCKGGLRWNIPVN